MQDAGCGLGGDGPPRSTTNRDGDLDVVEPHKAAARWLVGLTAGNCTDEFVAAFEMWISFHPANERAFQEMCSLWLKLGAPLMVDQARRGAFGAWTAPITGKAASSAEQ